MELNERKKSGINENKDKYFNKKKVSIEMLYLCTLNYESNSLKPENWDGENIHYVD